MANWGYVAIDKTGKRNQRQQRCRHTGSFNERTQTTGTHRLGGQAAEYFNTGYQLQL